jgi:predicted O-methyltransferase YrrM
MNQCKIFEKLNIKNPYTYIKTLDIKETVSPNWGGKCKIFNNFIMENKPKLILELGAYLGDSTISMAKSLKTNDIDGCIITVDTWLGSQEHWLKNKCNMLYMNDYFERGISSLYDKFCKNVLENGVENFIIPMPTTTDTAFDILKELGIKVDMIYMDADHREHIIYNDLCNYQTLLNPNGIIFGHDIDWIGVKKGVKKYCDEYGKVYTEHGDDTQENRAKFWRIV